jgi:hypothetical protein
MNSEPGTQNFIYLPLTKSTAMTDPQKEFKPFVPANVNMKELTVKSILLGCLFGVIFGAATVYLAHDS